MIAGDTRVISFAVHQGGLQLRRTFRLSLQYDSVRGGIMMEVGNSQDAVKTSCSSYGVAHKPLRKRSVILVSAVLE